MSSNQQLHPVVDRILSRLREQLEEPLRAYADELTRAAAAERTRAVEEATADVRRQGQEQLAELRETARKQNDDLRRSAETQIGELRKLLEDIRRNAQQQIDTARKTVETEVAAARSKADADVEDARRVAQGQVEDVQRASDARVAAIGGELDAARRELAAARQQLQEAERRAAQQARRGSTGDLAQDIASLDDATSLRDALDRLAEAAVRHCDRAALLTVRADRLHEWRMIGFAGRPSAGRAELAPDEAGIAGLALTEARTIARSGGALPPFAASVKPADAAAFPVSVAGSVVAVLYADVSADHPPPDWMASVDVLTRHAGRVLETLTVRTATGVRPLAHPSQPASASAGPTADPTTHPSSRRMQ